MTKHIDLTAYNTRYELDPARIASANVPEGFKPIKIGGPFISDNGPLFARWTGTRLQLGFRVEDRHCNPLMNCHGGMLASFADMLMPAVAIYQGEGERRFLPTISLQIDYLSGAKLGAWVQGEGEVLRRTRNMLFAQGLVSADGEAAMRVSGVFKQGPLIGGGDDTDPFKLQW
ncbi:MAG: PaaI family thioesterase [Betaproteobacteria bacterium]|jgi:uncharacterized protein (TIGR00369 family)|nr:PaaI family thioesterase [Betaproteobacteria bacterium]